MTGRDEAPAHYPWMELTLAVLMALAAVGTAWAGFQSSKWGGVQANSYASANAARTDSIRASTEAGQDRLIDVVTFGTWLDALDTELTADPSAAQPRDYQPDPDAVSGFVLARLRDEFQPAMDAWLAADPLANPDAPATPFDLPEYQLAAEAEARTLQQEADDLSARARAANQRSDNYVLTAVVFALVLFFAGVAGRARGAQSQKLLLGFAVVVMVAAAALLATLPVTV